MSSYLVVVSPGSFPEAMRCLSAVGEVGIIGMQALVVRAEQSVDALRALIQQVAPACDFVVVAEVVDVSYKGDGQVAFAAKLVRDAS